jgi:hypothetical protein
MVNTYLFSNYCGLGGYQDGTIQHEVDGLCKVHDTDYGTIQASGQNPYNTWNWADEKFEEGLDRIQRRRYPNSFQEWGAHTGSKFFLRIKENLTSFKHEVISELAVNPKGEIEDMGRGALSPKRLRGNKGGAKVPTEGRHAPVDFTTVRRNQPHEIPLPTDPNTPEPIPNDESEDDDMMQSAVNMAQAFSSGGNHRGHETQITKAPFVEHPGFSNTRTVELAGSFETICQLTGSTGVMNMSFRTTALTDVIPSFSTLAFASTGTRFTYNNENGVDFAQGINTTTLPAEAFNLGWYNMYADLYDKYAVLGCHYEVTIKNRSEVRGDDAMVFMTTLGVDDFPTNVGVTEMLSQNLGNIKRVYSGRNTPGDDLRLTKFSGYYRPGDFKDKIVEDANVQIWTNVGAVPTHRELIFFRFMKATDSAHTSNTHQTNLYLQVRLKYIVQFKDLKEKFRFPTKSTTKFTNDLELYGRFP